MKHPGALRDCPDCRGESYLVERNDAYAVAQLCGCVRTCPVCKDTGFVATSDTFRAPLTRCACMAFKERIRRFNAAGIPARHAHCTLVSFDPSDKKVTPIFGEVRKYLQSYHAGESNRGLVLYGEVGRGKTHLMVAVLRELIFSHGVSGRFVEFSHLIADLKSQFDRGQGAADLLDRLTGVQVLAIDELGKGRNTEFEGTVVDELISRFYNASKTVLATTNYAPGPPTGQATPNLSTAGRRTDDRPKLVDRVGDRVYSRIEEMCDFYPLMGGDYRLRHRKWSHS